MTNVVILPYLFPLYDQIRTQYNKEIGSKISALTLLNVNGRVRNIDQSFTIRHVNVKRSFMWIHLYSNPFVTFTTIVFM